MAKLTNITVKGQVTIPKDVRDALGLRAGDAVEVTLNDRGEAVIRAAPRGPDDREARYAAALAVIESAREHFRHLRTGRSTEEIMRELRGDGAMR